MVSGLSCFVLIWVFDVGGFDCGLVGGLGIVGGFVVWVCLIYVT